MQERHREPEPAYYSGVIKDRVQDPIIAYANPPKVAAASELDAWERWKRTSLALHLRGLLSRFQ